MASTKRLAWYVVWNAWQVRQRGSYGQGDYCYIKVWNLCMKDSCTTHLKNQSVNLCSFDQWYIWIPLSKIGFIMLSLDYMFMQKDFKP